MRLNEYQEQAKTFARYKNPEYAFDNLASEAGEVMGKIAKVKRGDFDDAFFSSEGNFPSDKPIQYLKELDPDPILKEMGDVLWQLAACCNEMGVTLDELALMNLNKLRDRQSRSKLLGSGDDR